MAAVETTFTGKNINVSYGGQILARIINEGCDDLLGVDAFSLVWYDAQAIGMFGDGKTPIMSVAFGKQMVGAFVDDHYIPA